jgi:hypothetical protein
MSGAYTGWIICDSADTPQQTGVVNVAPRGHQGPVWMAGSDVASDGCSVFVLNGNGTFGITLDTNGFAIDNAMAIHSWNSRRVRTRFTDDFTPLDAVRPTALILLQSVLQRIAAQHENWRRLACFWRAALPRRDMLD